jgi:hypothetical protein
MTKDKFGFYQVGNLKVYSKVEALELQAKFNQPISWHYNDHVFETVEWTKEPVKSLADFYQERAKQIRDCYDRVILFYSGGADSHNMLHSFIQAGVHIDEIVSFHSFSADADWHSEFNKEISCTAVPVVKNLKEQGLLPADTVHRLIDMSDIIKQFCADINWLDFPYMFSSSVSINNVARAHLRKYVTDWAKIIDQGQRLVLVWGHDKPRIMHDQGKFFLNFMDIYDNCVSTWIQQTAPAGWYDEMFYSTPDMPYMIVKQAHTIKNFLQTADENHAWLSSSVTGLGHVIKHRSDGSWQAKWLTQDAQSMLIYPWFQPELYYESKPKDIIYSKRDRWFWTDQLLSNDFEKTVQGLIANFGHRWLNQDTAKGLRSTQNFRSRRYWLD